MKNEQADKSEQRLNSVAIIGCGWLGSALVKSLVANQYHVIATTQQVAKLTHIQALGAEAEILSLPFNEAGLDKNSVFDCQTLVICITPGIRQGKKDYADKVVQLVQQAEKGQVNKIILISSTAVYDGNVGDVTEMTTIQSDIEKVAIISGAEQAVLSFKQQSIVVRAAGLVGKDRHPGKFFQQQRKLKDPNAYVNLIHQTDLVAQLQLLIQSVDLTGVFNAVSETQLTKKQYYSTAAQVLNLPAPVFDDGIDENVERARGKNIIGSKLSSSIAYQFKYGDMLHWLKADDNDQ